MRFILVTFASLLIGPVLFAKDLSHRLGVGYADNSVLSLPSLALKYHMNQEFALGFDLGFDTQKDNSRFATSARLYKTIFIEENLNFFGGASAGALSHEVNATNVSGFEISVFLGCEFFVPGLDSLGLSFEAGLAVSNDSLGTRFRTIADHPLRAGMVFYF